MTIAYSASNDTFDDACDLDALLHPSQAIDIRRRNSIKPVGELAATQDLAARPARRLEDGINAVRVFLPKCWFDAEKCARGIDALKLYRAEYDDKLQALRGPPVHDGSSHAADSFRYLALTLDRRATHSASIAASTIRSTAWCDWSKRRPLRARTGGLELGAYS